MVPPVQVLGLARDFIRVSVLTSPAQSDGEADPVSWLVNCYYIIDTPGRESQMSDAWRQAWT